ncbi:MAG: SPOR domain-containing protein [Saprospiraceae bacterium]|nr:SPOR domain-containing protein [Saprospiraceae bacterium]
MKPAETKPAETKKEAVAETPVKQPEKPAATEPKVNAAPPVEKKTETPADLNGYAVQVGAFPPESVDAKLKQFEGLSAKGNIYTRQEASMSKVRLGVYPTKAEAQAVQKEITADAKYKGAFVVEERGANRNLAFTAKPAAATTTSPATEVNNIRFAVQLDVQTGSQPLAIHDYTALASLGRIYTKNNEKGQLSIRLGVWQNYAEAESARTSSINKGFDHSIIVQENASDPDIKPFLKSGDPALSATPTTKDKPLEYFSVNAPPPSPTKYYIRICALSDPSNFDQSKLGDVKGNLEKWTIGETGMTAIMLTGFTDEKTAMENNEKIKGKGFPDAYVIKEENGKLNRLRYE